MSYGLVHFLLLGMILALFIVASQGVGGPEGPGLDSRR